MSGSREEPSISGDLFLVVASWFLRRSGSRVSIIIACRRTVPVALSLCVNPMPSRITRKSTRPRVADRTMVDTVQPRVLASFRNRSALSLLMNMQLLRWSKAKPETTGQDTRLERHSYLTRDWMPRTITRASGGGRRMFLTSPLIEQAFSPTTVPGCPGRGRECNGDVTSTTLWPFTAAISGRVAFCQRAGCNSGAYPTQFECL